MKKGILALIFGIFLNLSVNASMVSFCVVETGLPLEGAKNQHSQRWEGAFMDVFFDAGYIVSNAPITRLEEPPDGDILQFVPFDLEGAREAGIDYMLLAQLDYSSESSTPVGVSFILYKVIPGEKIYEKRFAGKRYSSLKDEVAEIKKLIGKVIPYISE